MVGKLGGAGDQRDREHDQQHRRLGERGDHHLARRADAAERGADIHAGERRARSAPVAEQRDDGDQVGRPGEQQPGRVGRHQRRRDPGDGEHRDTARRDRARRRCGRAPPPCASASRDRDRAATAAARSGAASRALTLRVTPSTSGAIASTRNICSRLQEEFDRSAPCRHHQSRSNQGAEHQRQIAADGEELEIG